MSSSHLPCIKIQKNMFKNILLIRPFDPVTVIGLVIVFGLPLTLLVPGFSLWDVVPKMRVTRYPAFSFTGTWTQVNGFLISALIVLCGLYLEIRRRRLDELVDTVLTTKKATLELKMQQEQSNTLKTSVQLLDVTAENYEQFFLLKDDIRQKEKCWIRPPDSNDNSC